MRNVKMQVDGDTLTIRVDLSQTQGPSKSGKTIIIASTGGNKPVEGYPGVMVGLNVYRKAT